MKDILSNLDPNEMLDRCKEILREESQLPIDCPLPEDCLSFASAKIKNSHIAVEIDASPPQLPTENKNLENEYNPICVEKCGIEGKASNSFKVVQEIRSGKVMSAVGRSDLEWALNRIYG